MPPSEAPTGQQPEGNLNLEDRLRGLILNNATSNSAPSSAMQPLAMSHLPPHMMMATPEDQQAYLARATAAPQPVPSIPQGQASQPQPGRKKLNQAQRRQMNSQLSIPIDLGPRHNSQPVRGYGNPQQSRPSQYYSGNALPQYNQRVPQQSPQFQQLGSPYSPHGPYPQGPQPSSRGYYQHGTQQFHPRQGQQYAQPQHQPGNLHQGFNRPPPQNRQLYQPGAGQGLGRPMIRHDSDDIAGQSAYLERLYLECVPNLGIDPQEEAEKEAFRVVVEQACREAITEFEQQLGNADFNSLSVELTCFGSMSSGFATKSSDMDLALVTPYSMPPADSPESRIPRILEKKLLDVGYGARLLTRTRVPIIKLCQKPTEQLRADLIEARTKWESGFTDDGEGRAESPEERGPTNTAEAIDEKLLTSSMSRPEDVQKEPNGSVDYLAQIKQKKSQTAVDYYNNAKRILRKMGGFDLSPSSPEPNAEQFKLLNHVCRAFISGLSSETLSLRLRNYKSISPLFEQSGEPCSFQRTLNGVFTQIEGERLAMAYDARPLTEAKEHREAECLAAVEAWRLLQDKYGPLTESRPEVWYNRQLYTAYEKLKNMSSLAFMFLEQLQTEEPTYYAARARRFMDDLKQRTLNEYDTVTPIIIAHYVSGIRNPQIREDMRNLSLSQQSFDDVVLQHKVLQLAVDFEHSLKVDLYAEEDRPYVEQYVAFLRSRTIGSESQPVDSDLLSKIRILPDPMQISQNKPRDRYRDHLEFPKTNIGIQCDINFSAHLALHNTLLLRCYSHSDPRVRYLILFVKNWAKVRAINTPYRGTLSSYGYVLMVLHYLVHISFPFVCPNLQEVRKEPPPHLPPAEIEARTTCKGRDVRFWRNEAEIKDLANRGLLNQNRDSVGVLLRGFFEYFAQSTQMSTVNNRGFDWGREVLSLRTQGGILTKQEKGWTGAKTVFEITTVAAPPTPSSPAMKVDIPNDSTEGGGVIGEEAKMAKLPIKTIEETKEIRHRYLFAIEDPFELDHNVARTVS